MPRKKKAQKKSIIKLWMLILISVLFFLLLFRRELTTVMAYRFTGREADEVFRQARRVVNFNFWRGFVFTFLFWLLIASLQSLLPISGLRDVFRTMRFVIRHTLRKGNVFRVIGGHVVSPLEKTRRQTVDFRTEPARAHLREASDADWRETGKDHWLHGSRGVLLLDSDSAAVLERAVLAPNILTQIRQAIRSFLMLPEPEKLRICGPGLVFMKPIERVHSFVDLRKQIRSEKEVISLTGDGIEVSSFVFSVFSVGRKPVPLELAYNGGWDEECFQTVVLKKEKGRVHVSRFVDDLAADDRKEAHLAAQNTNILGPMEGFDFLSDKPDLCPVYDEDRVFRAVFARARNGYSETMNWEELPLIFTRDAFKEMAAQFNFDELSNPEGGSRLQEFKNRVNTAVRNQCYMTYRVVLHKSGKPLQENESYAREELLVSPVRAFNTPKVLRERGIMNIYSAFTSITPCMNAIYQQRLDNWQARLERETNLVAAKRELEVHNIYSRARIQAQRELSTALNDILKDRRYSEEAMALMVFQALEEYARNPKTRQRLPNEVITLLRNVHDRILPPDARGFPFLRD